MTRFRVTLVLVLLLGGAQAQSGYWWMGQDGSFGSTNGNIEQVNIDKVNSRAAGYGYRPPAASNNQPTDLQEEASEILINNDLRESDTGYISPSFELPPPSASSAPAQNQIAPVAPVNNPPFKQVSIQQSPSISSLPPSSPSSQTTCPPVTSLP